jgi:hypothetical protein
VVPIAEALVEDTPPSIGLCGWILTGLSLCLVLLTVPFSLFLCFKVHYMVIYWNSTYTVQLLKIKHEVVAAVAEMKMQ